MADVNIQLGHKNAAWFTANASVVLLDGQIVYLNDQSGQYKLGDGITALSALSFLGGGGGGTQNLDQVLTEGNATGGNNIVVTNGDLIKSTDNKSGLAIGTNGYAELSSSNFDGAESYCYLDAATAALYSQGVNGVSTDNNYMLLTHSTDLRIVSPIVRLNGVNLQTTLDGKVDENAAITGATKTKITYDAKGLVTSGTDATTADINASTNRNYVTDAQLVVIGNTSGTNTGDETATRIGTIVNGATNYATPLDADKVGIWDVANSLFKALTWANLKATLKTYFDTLYATVADLANKTDKGDIGITSFRNATYNPPDSTTIFLRITNNLAPSTSSGNACAIVPFASSNIVITLDALTTGTAGTNENITVKLLNVTQATEETISTTYQMGGTTNSQALTSTLSFAANDFVAVSLTFPVFATNPTGVYFHAHLTFTK